MAAKQHVSSERRGDFEGGRFHIEDRDGYDNVVEPVLGGGVIFDAEAAHAVAPVISGNRTVLVVEFWPHPDTTAYEGGRPEVPDGRGHEGGAPYGEAGEGEPAEGGDAEEAKMVESATHTARLCTTFRCHHNVLLPSLCRRRSEPLPLRLLAPSLTVLTVLTALTALTALLLTTAPLGANTGECTTSSGCGASQYCCCAGDDAKETTCDPCHECCKDKNEFGSSGGCPSTCRCGGHPGTSKGGDEETGLVADGSV